MLIGNVGKDPEIRYIEGNATERPKVATFPVATSESYKGKDGERKTNTEWHNVVAYRQTADIIEKYVKKGTQVYIEGKLRTRQWNDQAGNKRFTTEIVVDSLQLLGAKPQDEGQPRPRMQSEAPQTPQQAQKPVYHESRMNPQPPAQPNMFTPMDDDLPF